MEDKVLTRREFTRESVMALLSGVVITITGCSGSDGSSSSPMSPTPPAEGGVGGSVSANHGHVAFVTDAQIAGGNDIALDISGSAGHPHTINLTGAELGQIGNGQRVTKTSSVSQITGTHSHNVTFN